jgi:hypothetical protein
VIWLSCVLNKRALPVRGEALKERLEFALFDKSGEAKCLCTLAKIEPSRLAALDVVIIPSKLQVVVSLVA